MMFALDPACIDPTVTTARSVMETSRETMVWSRITVAAAITTGSMVDSGPEPCPPRPITRTSKVSTPAISAPARLRIEPVGCLEDQTCRP